MRRLLEAALVPAVFAAAAPLVLLLAVLVAIGWSRDLEDLQREGR